MFRRTLLAFPCLLLLTTAALVAAAANLPCAEQPEIKRLLQRANADTASFDEILASLQKAARSCHAPPLFGAISTLLLRNGRPGDALKWISRGLQFEPRNPELRLQQGIALLSAGRAENAVRTLQQLPATAVTEFYLGMAQRRLGAHQEARSALLRAYNLGYGNPYVLYVVIEQDRFLGDKAAGLEHYQIFERNFPQSPFLHLLLGDAYLSQKDEAGAEREYREALTANPKLPVVHSKLGFVEFGRARYAEAADLFREEIALNPGFAEAHLYLGLCLRRLSNNLQAIDAFTRALDLDETSVVAYQQLALADLQEGRVDEALRVLRAGLRKHPDDQALNAQLARVLTKLGRENEAKTPAQAVRQVLNQNDGPRTGEVMNQHATLEPVRPRAEAPRRKDDRAAGGSAAQIEVASPNGGGDPLLGKVRACLARQNPLCAESELKRVKRPETLHSAEYHQLRADTLRLQNRLPDALGAIRTAIGLNAVEPRYWIMQGELQQQSGDQISAIQSFLQATKLEQRSPAPLYHIGMSFFILARHENSDDYYARARRHFELALKADAGYSRAEFMLGIIDAIQNRLSDARLRFERALQLEPRNPFYQLHYGVLLNRSGDDNGALAALTEAERIDPGYAPVHLHLGKLYSRLGRYAEARSELESASKLDPNLADAHYSLGSVYRHLGMTAMSQQAYQQFQAAKRQQLAADPVESVITAVPAE